MRNGANPAGVRRVALRFVAFPLLLAALASPASFAHAAVWENVTVISMTEGEYFNVTVESLPGDSTAMVMIYKGARKILPFDKIRVILDRDGKDITALVFPGLREPADGASIRDSAAVDQPPVSPATRVAAPRASKGAISLEPVELPRKRKVSLERRFVFMFSGGAGYGAPVGDWFETMNSGFSGGVALRFGAFHNMLLGFSYRRQELRIDEEYKLFCVEDGLDSYCLPIDWDIHLDELYFSLGYLSRVSTPKSPFAYMEVGFGVIKHAIKSVAPGGEEAASDETELGLLLDAGGVFPFSKEIGLNIEGDMRMTGKDFDPIRNLVDPSGPNGLLFAFKIGVVVMLGGGQ